MEYIEQYLKENYLIKTKKQMASELNVDYFKVEYLLKKLHLTHYKHNEWTESEIMILKENYPKQMSKKELMLLLPNRNWSAIQKQASKLGCIRQWDHTYISEQGYLVDCTDRDNKIEIHRRIYEQAYNVKLGPNDIIHHKDGNKLNNSIDNLELHTRSSHLKLHWEHVTKTRIKR